MKMASSSTDFLQALEFLAKVQWRIEQVRQQNEMTLHRITELFKRPWPHLSQNAPKPQTTPPASQIQKDAVGERVKKSDDLFSAEEQTVLHEVDSVLAKAQKLRHFQEKVRGKKSDGITKGTISDKSAVTPVPPKPSSSADQNKNDLVGKESCEISSSNLPTDADKHCDVAVISAKDLDRLLKKDPSCIKDKQHAPLSCPSSGSQTISDNSRLKTKADGAASRTKVERDSARAKRMSSLQFRTSSSEIGKHVTRPSSRYESTQSRFRQQAKVKPLPQDKSKRATQANINQNNPRQHLPHRDKPQTTTSKHPSDSSKTPHLPTHSSRPPSGSANMRTRKAGQRQAEPQEGVPAAVEVNSLAKSVSGMQMAACSQKIGGADQQRPLSPGEPQQDLRPDPDASVSQQQQFMLSKDGGSLTIPSKLRKQRNHNAKLREKLQTLIQQECREHADQFLHLLSPGSCQHPTEASIQAACERLSREYCHLTDLARDVKRRLAAIHKSTGWEDVYYLHTMSQAIRERYEELGHEFKQLRLAESQIPRFNPEHDRGVSPDEAEEYLGKSPFLWNCSRRSQELVSLHGANVLSYSCLDDLLQWNRLVYQVQYLDQEQRLQEVIGEAVLSALAEMDPTHPDFPSVYRLAHGVIVNAGALFPSMITDEDQEGNSDDEDLSQDE